MSTDKPNSIDYGYQDENRKCKRSRSQIERYGPRLHTEDGCGECGRVEDLQTRRIRISPRKKNKKPQKAYTKLKTPEPHKINKCPLQFKKN
jgi:hypothetical protein